MLEELESRVTPILKQLRMRQFWRLASDFSASIIVLFSSPNAPSARRTLSFQAVHTRRLAGVEEKRGRSILVVNASGKTSPLRLAVFVHEELEVTLSTGALHLHEPQLSEGHQRQLFLDDRIKAAADYLQHVKFLARKELEHVDDRVADREHRNALKQIFLFRM